MLPGIGSSRCIYFPNSPVAILQKETNLSTGVFLLIDVGHMSTHGSCISPTQKLCKELFLVAPRVVPNAVCLAC